MSCQRTSNTDVRNIFANRISNYSVDFSFTIANEIWQWNTVLDIIWIIIVAWYSSIEFQFTFKHCRDLTVMCLVSVTQYVFIKKILTKSLLDEFQNSWDWLVVWLLSKVIEHGVCWYEFLTCLAYQNNIEKVFHFVHSFIICMLDINAIKFTIPFKKLFFLSLWHPSWKLHVIFRMKA